MSEINTINTNTQNNESNENTYVYLTDVENKYLLDKSGVYLTTTYKKENDIMANTKKYVSLDKLGLYDEKIKKFLGDADTAVLNSAKEYADGLASNYDTAGAAATAQANAKSYTDAEVAKANAAAAAAQAQADKGVADAAAADGKAVKAQGDVDTLKDYVGTIPADATATDVVGYVIEKTTGIASEGAITELGNRITAVEGDVATIMGDYLKDADKTELEGKISAKADTTALDAVSAVANAAATQDALTEEVNRAKGEEARIEGLVTAEAQRAANAESGLSDRLDEVEAFFHLAEGESLDAALDTLKEIQTYITGEGAAADQMVLDIAANAQAIEDMDAAYKAADVTLQANIDKKADATVVDGINGRVGALETASATHALKTEVEAVSDAFDEYKNAHTGDYTNAQIDAAIKAVADDVDALGDTYATDAELTAAIEAEVTRANGAYAAKSLETIVATLSTTVDTKAAQSDVDTISGKVGTLETDMAQAKTDIDAVEALAAANKAAHEANAAAIALKASQADLEAVSGRVTTLETWHANFVECSQEDINGLFA